jgi:hypothetical protein
VVVAIALFMAIPTLASAAATPSLATDHHYCNGCTPPLDYRGGPVLDTNGTSGLTVTPVYWAPNGTSYQFPGDYESIVNGFVANVAAASGADSNVFSINQEYYDEVNGAKNYAGYNIKAGNPVIDTDAMPASECKPIEGATVCLKDQQLRDELTHLTKKLGLPTDIDHFYPVFLAPNVETQDRDGSNSANSYCGYHRSFETGSSLIDYADIPYESTGCVSGQAPNGNETADGAVSTLSHELNEAITDPEDPAFAWNDSSGNEIGDICAQDYGPPLGSTNPKNAGSTEYNQVINGGKYYVQTEFSDTSYDAQGVGQGCVQSEALAQHPQSSTGSTVASIFADAYPTRLSANGSATSDILVTVGDKAQNAISGDSITFQTYSRTGKGHCGKLNKNHATTDDTGAVTVKYTASTAEVACDVAAIEGDGGRSADSVIYQGTSQSGAPTIHAAFPSKVAAGGAPVTFTATLDNPASSLVPNAQIDFAFFPGDASPPKVDASQVHLSYSTNGDAGPFTPIALSGTTARGDQINGYAGPLQGSTLGPHSKTTYTFHLSVDGSVPHESGNHALMAIEAYFQQIDSASGSGTVLDDSQAYDISVTH